MPFLGLSGGVCGMEKGHAFWSASVDFHTLFGLVGGVCGAEKGHAFWSKSVDFPGDYPVWLLVITLMSFLAAAGGYPDVFPGGCW